MKRLIYTILCILLMLPIVSGCSPVDDDFFQGKTWYIIGLCPNKNTNILLQKDENGNPTDLTKEWQDKVMNNAQPRYYIQFGEKGAFTIQTENHTWRGTFTYDLSSHEVQFTFTNGAVSSELEKQVMAYLTDVNKYSGNNNYMQLERKNGGFIWMNPAPEGRALLSNQ